MQHPHTDNARIIGAFCSQAEVMATTRVKYAAHIAELSRWLAHPSSPAGVTGLIGVTRAEVVHFMAYLLEGDRYAGSPNARRRGSVAASTRTSVIGTLNAFFAYLVSISMIDDNPVAGVPRPRKRSRPGITLNAEELRCLLDVRTNPRDRVQTFLMVFTAARAGELRDLTWSDVDFPSGTITFSGKGDAPRAVDIHPMLMTELRRWYLYLDARAEIEPATQAALAAPSGGYVLMTRTGRKLSATTMSKQLKRRAVHAGLYELPSTHGEYRSLVSPHALRRSFATILLNDGHHLDAVADVLGHKSLDTTRRHYAFSSNEHRRATVEAFSV